jgi:hypothetical protein
MEEQLKFFFCNPDLDAFTDWEGQDWFGAMFIVRRWKYLYAPTGRAKDWGDVAVCIRIIESYGGGPVEAFKPETMPDGRYAADETTIKKTYSTLSEAKSAADRAIAVMKPINYKVKKKG